MNKERLYKGSNRFMNESMKSDIWLIPIACVPHKIFIFLQVMAVQQYKPVTNYAPNSELEEDERRRRITLDIPHTCMMLFGTGELFLFAKFSFIFSSIRFLNSVIT